jgi:hypothetical protein
MMPEGIQHGLGQEVFHGGKEYRIVAHLRTKFLFHEVATQGCRERLGLL